VSGYHGIDTNASRSPRARRHTSRADAFQQPIERDKDTAMSAAQLSDLQQTRYAVEDGVALVTLARPDHMNAFTVRMMRELLAIFEAADRDDGVRAVVVTGEGRAFCAGADLGAGASTFDAAKAGHLVGVGGHRDGGGQVALAIFSCRKPVIAAINGAAVGVGITMTLPMDVRIVAEDAKVGFVFARRGIVPEACSSWFLPRIVGISKAAELCYTGRVFVARDEEASGLFSYVVPREQVLRKAMEIAREIADNTSAVSVALSKALLWHGLGDDDPQSAHLIDSKCIHWTGAQADCYEGVQSFLEKRPPKFSMRPSEDMPDFYPWWSDPTF
jgi:enoyl-CoA hydratase/carnithine racemase